MHTFLHVYFVYRSNMFRPSEHPFREDVLRRLRPTVNRQATYLWFHVRQAALVMSSLKAYINLLLIDVSPTLPVERGTINNVASLLKIGLNLGITCSLKMVF
jgi:hypothetical protein